MESAENVSPVSPAFLPHWPLSTPRTPTHRDDFDDEPTLTVAARPRKLRLSRGIRASKEGSMDLIVRTYRPAPIRAWKALRARGVEYAWHKLLRRTLSDWPSWKRRFLYADPRAYWTLRGGDD